jgi:hypothetical protein
VSSCLARRYSSSGTLTPSSRAQRSKSASIMRISSSVSEAAKISGVSEREYAQQKVRLMLAKREGHYSGGG